MPAAARRIFSVMMIVAVAFAASACENLETGPTLSNVVLSALAKEATTEVHDASLCCCRATGTATNRNTVPVYLTVTLTALDLRGAAISKVLFFMPDIPPGQSAPIDAPGFIFPCNSISQFTAEVKVRGLTEPPQ
jgi:hypothetical protein